jgi:quercetin dioxygenase-like cupin family protein
MTMEAKGFVVPPGQGPIWEMAPGRSAALKLQNGETAESVMMFEETAPAGTVTPLHLHHDSDEVMYVLSGEITCMIGDQVTVGGPGTCAFMPRGVAHAWKNTGLETARALFIYTPGAAGTFFEEQTRLGRSFAAMDDREIEEVFQRHRWETVGPPPF